VRAHFPAATIHVVAPLQRILSLGDARLASERYICPVTSERFLAPRDRKRSTSRPILKPDEIELLAACACPARSEYLQIDKRIAELANSARAAHNASIILQEAKRASLVQ
jgi:hypothetical protein